MKTQGSDAPEGYVKIWEDHFEGSHLDNKNWIVGSLKDSVTGDLVPGAVGAHLLNQDYAGYITKEDAYVKDGCLVLRNQKRNITGTSPKGKFQYTSGWIMSMHRVFFNKGYVEIRAKFPSGDKVWPAFWLIPENLSWPPEIDMFEYFGYRKDVGADLMGNHLVCGTAADQKWFESWIHDYDSKYDNPSWHVYGFQWTSDSLVWYIDHKRVHRLLKNTEVSKNCWPDGKMYMVLNNGVRTAAPDSTTKWPNFVKVDYIKWYQLKDQVMKKDSIKGILKLKSHG